MDLTVVRMRREKRGCVSKGRGEERKREEGGGDPGREQVSAPAYSWGFVPSHH